MISPNSSCARLGRVAVEEVMDGCILAFEAVKKTDGAMKEFTVDEVIELLKIMRAAALKRLEA